MKNNVLILWAALFAVLFVACDDSEDTPANLPPTIAGQTFSVAEDAATGITVGTIVATDPEGNTLSFSIASGNTEDAFALDANSGTLTVAAPLDFETTPSYSLTVEVTDGTNTASAAINVEVTDVDESGSSGSVVGQLAATLTDGIIENYGPYDWSDNGELSHYDYEIGLSNDAFSGEGDFGLSTTFSIFLDLYSLGTDGFTPGTFEIISFEEEDSFDASSTSVGFVEMASFEEGSFNGDEVLPSSYYVASNGTVTVTDNGNSNYTLTFDITVDEADFESETMIEGTTQQFTFNFTSDFAYFDYTSEGGRVTGSSKKFRFGRK